MKLNATIQGDVDDFGEIQAPDMEVEFNDVKDYIYDNTFFIVRKENGDHHAVRQHRVKQFTLSN